MKNKLVIAMLSFVVALAISWDAAALACQEQQEAQCENIFNQCNARCTANFPDDWIYRNQCQWSCTSQASACYDNIAAVCGSPGGGGWEGDECVIQGAQWCPSTCSSCIRLY